MRTSDGEISRFGTRKYQNVLRVDTQTNAVSIAPDGWGEAYCLFRPMADIGVFHLKMRLNLSAVLPQQ